MRKILLYLLLCVYASSIFKPVMPYISDYAAHAFYYEKHIQKVHHENGTSHVHYELVKQAKHNNSDTENNMKKISLANEHVIIAGANQLSKTFIYHSYPLFKMPFMFGITLGKNFPPPRC